MKEGWKMKNLGDVATFQRGLTYSKNDEVEFSNNCVLRSNNIELETMSILLDELKYIREDLVVSEDKKVRKDTILICMSNGSKQHIGKVAFIDKEYDYAFGGFMGLIKPDSNIIPKYVYYSCISSSYKQFLASVGNGANITNIKFSDLSQFSFPVPSIAEQEKIVAELDCLSGIIEKKKLQLKEYDALAQSIFYEMFGNPEDNERGWQVKLWREVFDTQTGKLNANAMVENGEYPFFTCSKEIYHIDCYAFDSEALLLAGNNATANYDVKYYNGKFNAYQRTYVLTLKDDSLYHFFKFALENKLSLLQKQSIGGMTKYLTMGILEKISFIVPPLALQQEFASKIEAIEKQKALIKKSIEEVETLFNSRMDEYFN